jgi:hypothetical protein
VVGRSPADEEVLVVLLNLAIFQGAETNAHLP